MRCHCPSQGYIHQNVTNTNLCTRVERDDAHSGFLPKEKNAITGPIFHPIPGFNSYFSIHSYPATANYIFSFLKNIFLLAIQENPTPGWWESFIGPGCALDTDKFFIICCSNLGGCYGSRYYTSWHPVGWFKLIHMIEVVLSRKGDPG